MRPAVCSGVRTCAALVDHPGQLCPDCRAIARDAEADAAREVA